MSSSENNNCRFSLIFKVHFAFQYYVIRTDQDAAVLYTLQLWYQADSRQACSSLANLLLLMGKKCLCFMYKLVHRIPHDKYQHCSFNKWQDFTFFTSSFAMYVISCCHLDWCQSDLVALAVYPCGRMSSELSDLSVLENWHYHWFNNNNNTFIISTEHEKLDTLQSMD